MGYLLRRAVPEPAPSRRPGRTPPRLSFRRACGFGVLRSGDFPASDASLETTSTIHSGVLVAPSSASASPPGVMIDRSDHHAVARTREPDVVGAGMFVRQALGAPPLRSGRSRRERGMGEGRIRPTAGPQYDWGRAPAEVRIRGRTLGIRDRAVRDRAVRGRTPLLSDRRLNPNVNVLRTGGFHVWLSRRDRSWDRAIGPGLSVAGGNIVPGRGRGSAISPCRREIFAPASGSSTPAEQSRRSPATVLVGSEKPGGGRSLLASGRASG
jgi:hypothetical protein